ncbi:MAG: thioredoxin domain-containing protein [Anaerolineales bacterium]|nr:thioredoxin domain-containing protein [Anaerolineales bacterium]
MSPEKISKRQERRARLQRQQQQQRLITIGAIVLGATLVVLAMAWPQIRSTGETAANSMAVGEIATIIPVSLPDANGLVLGDPNAPALVEAFEDFQCSACVYYTESIETRIISDLVATGKARYIFRHYSFFDGEGAGNGGESDQAANASMCANEQGKFWEMHLTLYANWGGVNQGAFRDSRLRAMAESIGLDMDAFDECFSTNPYQAEIQADYDLGKEMQVNGTPTVYVNGKQVGQPGMIATYDEIAQAVEQVLNE